ncbi:MAG: hypothetical protein Q9169_008112 [Polycauliona sp. 2 TL-2023]
MIDKAFFPFFLNSLHGHCLQTIPGANSHALPNLHDSESRFLSGFDRTSRLQDEVDTRVREAKDLTGLNSTQRYYASKVYPQQYHGEEHGHGIDTRIRGGNDLAELNSTQRTCAIKTYPPEDFGEANRPQRCMAASSFERRRTDDEANEIQDQLIALQHVHGDSGVDFHPHHGSSQWRTDEQTKEIQNQLLALQRAQLGVQCRIVSGPFLPSTARRDSAGPFPYDRARHTSVASPTGGIQGQPEMGRPDIGQHATAELPQATMEMVDESNQLTLDELIAQASAGFSVTIESPGHDQHHGIGPAVTMDAIAISTPEERLQQSEVDFQELTALQLQDQGSILSRFINDNTMHEQADPPDHDSDTSSVDVAASRRMYAEARVQNTALPPRVRQLSPDVVQGQARFRRRTRRGKRVRRGPDGMVIPRASAGGIKAENAAQLAQIPDAVLEEGSSGPPEEGRVETANTGVEENSGPAEEASGDVATAANNTTQDMNLDPSPASPEPDHTTQNTDPTTRHPLDSRLDTSPETVHLTPNTDPAAAVDNDALQKCKAYERVIARLGSSSTLTQHRLKALASMSLDPVFAVEIDVICAEMATGSNLAMRYLLEYPVALARLRPYSNGMLKEAYLEHQLDGREVDL